MRKFKQGRYIRLVNDAGGEVGFYEIIAEGHIHYKDRGIPGWWVKTLIGPGGYGREDFIGLDGTEVLAGGDLPEGIRPITDEPDMFVMEV